MPDATAIARLRRQEDALLRDPATVVGLFEPDGDTAVRLRYHASRGWWQLLADLDLALLITREYEHLVTLLASTEHGPSITYVQLPHPSGVAVDPERAEVHIALTRNPNQIISFRPAPISTSNGSGCVLWPSCTQYFAGSNYFHDLVWLRGEVFVTAVGRNTVVRVADDGSLHDAWWPKSVERDGVPDRSRNRLQLNSIAAADRLETSFLTASVAAPGRFDPGHTKFNPDRRGVLFDGRTREVLATGLTRPHSARLHDGHVWLANSGYGELVQVSKRGAITVVARLPGWTRGLYLYQGIGFVGTSRVLPRFEHYAPGVTAAECGVHAVELTSGRVLASITWPAGNQIFAVEALPRSMKAVLPYNARRSHESNARNVTEIFYQGPGSRN